MAWVFMIKYFFNISVRKYPRYLVDGVMVAEVTKGTSLLPSSTLTDILILNGRVIVILNFANYL